jgi:hypothetical protein
MHESHEASAGMRWKSHVYMGVIVHSGNVNHLAPQPLRTHTYTGTYTGAIPENTPSIQHRFFGSSYFGLHYAPASALPVMILLLLAPEAHCKKVPRFYFSGGRDLCLV